MKRLFSLFIAIVLFTMPFTASAVNDTPSGEIISTTVEILDDGTILETVIYVENSTASTYATKTVSGSKTTTGKNVSAKRNSKGAYTFTMPDDEVVVTAKIVKKK